jgi:hypothetical protein
MRGTRAPLSSQRLVGFNKKWKYRNAVYFCAGTILRQAITNELIEEGNFHWTILVEANQKHFE